MLRFANMLTAEELDEIRLGPAAVQSSTPPPEEDETPKPEETVSAVEDSDEEVDQPQERSVVIMTVTRGERERQRSRESKVSTGCLGQARTPHPWWPVGTELEGRIGNEIFSASVVENPRVKSGKSIRIDSGPAEGRVCITPTRAAIEATEEYRRIANLGRGGGITNGWTFWQPKR